MLEVFKMFLLNVMLFFKVLRVIEFLNILLVASIMPSGDTNNSTGSLTDIHSHLIHSEEKTLLPNVVRVLMLLLINPATSASAERLFSMARRLKTWER